MASILDPYRPLIAKACTTNPTDADILRLVQSSGCIVGRERVRTWLAEETKAGRIPSRTFVVRRGRRPAQGSVFQQTEAAKTALDTSAAEGAPSPPPLPDVKAFAKNFNIPLGGDRHLDLHQWARNLGSDRIKSMSDMEMFLLESFETPWRDNPQRWTGTWVDSVLKSSHELRQQMLAAAEIHELTRTCESRPTSPGA